MRDYVFSQGAMINEPTGELALICRTHSSLGLDELVVIVEVVTDHPHDLLVEPCTQLEGGILLIPTACGPAPGSDVAEIGPADEGVFAPSAHRLDGHQVRALVAGTSRLPWTWGSCL